MIRLILLFYFQQGLTRRQYLLPLNRAREFEMYKMRSTEKQHQHGGEFQDAVEVLPNADEVPEIGEEPCQEQVDGRLGEMTSSDQLEQNSFKLPSSGRLIRHIDSAPAKSKRLWITPVQTVRLRRLLQVY